LICRVKLKETDLHNFPIEMKGAMLCAFFLLP
jgi:hypothetical protein